MKCERCGEEMYWESNNLEKDNWTESWFCYECSKYKFIKHEYDEEDKNEINTFAKAVVKTFREMADLIEEKEHDISIVISFIRDLRSHNIFFNKKFWKISDEKEMEVNNEE